MVPTAISQLWVADITYVRLRQTFLYLAIVLDAYARRVIGWEPGEDLSADLALGALRSICASAAIKLTLAPPFSSSWRRSITPGGCTPRLAICP